MTAINVLIQDDAARIYTDTRAAVDGWAVGNVAKCQPLPHLNCAVATRGPVMALNYVVRLLGEASTFRDVRRILATKLPLQPQNEQDREIYKHDFEVWAVGYDGRPQGFAIFGHNKHGLPAWKVLELGPLTVTPTIPEEAFRLLSEAPVERITEVLMLQAIQNPEIIGGHAVETAVTPTGILTRSLGRLPERKPELPANGVKLPAAFAKHLAAEKFCNP